MTLQKLTEDELSKPYADYYNRPPAPVPGSVLKKIDAGPLDPRHALRFEDINRLLDRGYGEDEIGYCIMPDGSGFASMLTDMPGVTGEMVDWWFAWHPGEDLRYKIWYPGAHAGIDVDDRKRLSDVSLSFRERYLNNTNYPLEDVGSGVEKLSITFVPPQEFGFDIERFSEARVATVLCALVGYPRLRLRHTYMVHFVRNTDHGVELRSRFWLGYNARFEFLSEQSLVNTMLNKKTAKKMIMKEKTARNMALHCAQEYHNLARILPPLYRQYENQ